MSTGSAPIPLLKAAPEPDQVAERLAGGPWAGMELALLPRHVADDAALDRAIAVVRDGVGDTPATLLAESPVSWPSGAHVRVDRLDDEARAGIERLVAAGEWPDLLYAGSGEATALEDAARLAVEAAGSDVPIETPGGTLPPGEDDSYALDPHVPRLASPARPLAEAVASYVDWLSSHPAAQGRAGA